MKKVALVLLLLLLPVVCGDVSVYKVWSPYDPPNSPILHVDISEQVLYLGIVNKDEYEHDVIVKVECEGKTWESGLIPLPPNSHVEKIVEVRVPISDDKEHDAKISLIENGKTIASTTVKVKQYFPVDVKNVTCEDSYKIGNTEICYSNWFDVTLKSNPTAKSDYIAKVWINIKDGDNVIYNGKNDFKTVYIPFGEEVKVSFKVPKIVLDKEKFTVETNVEIMNVTHTIDGIEETVQKRDDSGIYYDYKSITKYYYLPVVVKNVELYRKIDENTSKIVKNFYDSAGILDNEIREVLSDKYLQKDDVLPRYYVKDDPTLAILKITVENKYNKDVTAILTVKYGNRSVNKIINIGKKEKKDIFVPIYTKRGSKNIEITIHPIDVNTLIFSKSYSINIEPKPIPPVIIEKIILPKDKEINEEMGPGGYVLIGKKYNMSIILKNIYNKTLSGKIIVDDNFKYGVVNYSKEIPFAITPHQTKEISIPIVFYKEVNGDLKITVSVKGGAKDYTCFAHFYAISPIDIVRIYYNNTLLLGRINVIKGNGGIYSAKPIAGFNNTCVVVLRNNLNSKVDCDIWIEVIDKDGNVRAKSSAKTVHLNNYSEVEVEFPIFFDEGFEGYTVAHIIPKSVENVDIIYTEGYGIHLVKISNYYRVGRYSAIDILGDEIPTGTHVVTEVISPVNIEDLNYNNNILKAKIRNDKFPVNLTVQYWVEVSKGSNIYYKSSIFQTEIYPKSEKELMIPLRLEGLESGTYNVTLYVRINDFALFNYQKVPVILKKSISIEINGSKGVEGHEFSEKNEKINGTSESYKNMTESTHNKTYILNNNESNIKEFNNTNYTGSNVENESIFGKISKIVGRVISTILGLFR
ncbi:conserved hypothetical protein [Methanocaldococcus sp. FS406-22]|uniref:hypothetical protein n=1 Tax=Methanocaldococcus sp. (strain FS406-22) TaxID=644281 RepID=UPI0001BF4819|nr:hypothetical protein [Methanocaldococcus sp. FS406-22]ADC69932.1 conserved hypothetical protein [Methanocaldococcus sp. FS406-22]